MKTIICTVGLPRSGKTTWARKQGIPIVSPDSIRYALHGNRFIGLAEVFVWAIAYCMARSLLLAGHDLILIDATNTTRKRRQEWVNQFKDCKILFKVIDTTKEVCLKRANAENDKEIIPIIERMADQYEKLTDEEDTLPPRIGGIWTT